MDAFQEVIESCTLSGIPTNGPKYTWSNNRQGKAYTKEKLDRALANPKGLEVFSESHCKVLPALKSNHSPFIISTSGRNEQHRKSLTLLDMKLVETLMRNVLKSFKIPGKDGACYNLTQAL